MLFYIYIFVQKGGIVIIRGIYMLLNRMAIIKMGINNYIRYIYIYGKSFQEFCPI